MASKRELSISSILAFGLLGSGLVYFGRRTSPGVVATVATTAGYGLITKAVSAAIVAALAPSEVEA